MAHGRANAHYCTNAHHAELVRRWCAPSAIRIASPYTFYKLSSYAIYCKAAPRGVLKEPRREAPCVSGCRGARSAVLAAKRQALKPRNTRPRPRAVRESHSVGRPLRLRRSGRGKRGHAPKNKKLIIQK